MLIILNRIFLKSGIPRRYFVQITASAVPEPALLFLLFQVSTAAKFLKNPKIAPSPLAQKRAFLKSKGLTEEQIEMACLQAGISSNEENMTSSSPSPSSPVAMKNYPLISSPNPQNSWLTKLRDLANLVLVLGGAAYGLHFLWQVKQIKELLYLLYIY